MSWVPVVRASTTEAVGTARSGPDSLSTYTQYRVANVTLPFLERASRDPPNTSSRLANSSLPFLEMERTSTTIMQESIPSQEPAEVIVARVLYALLISISLVMNLLLVIAVLRCRAKVPVIYLLTSAMVIPDVIFYTKLIVELTDWGVAIPSWAVKDQSCGIWQFGSHVYPILYSSLLTAIVYHAFVLLYMDHTGKYEAGCRRLLPLILLAVIVFLSIICAPSGFYARAKVAVESAGANATSAASGGMAKLIAQSSGNSSASNGAMAKLVVQSSGSSATQQQYCDLFVPAISGKDSADLQEQSIITYRLVYELVLPYLLPLVLIAFPYVCLLVGLMRSLSATEHTEHVTKMAVVVTLWLVTSYLMLHVATVLRNVFSIFSVWHKLTALLDAVNDPRVPMFQTYIHIAAYTLTILWAIARPALVFKYSPRLRKALGP